ncbi:MAG: hypothetical protein R2758_05625 [Bacteroidales bacterium]
MKNGGSPVISLPGYLSVKLLEGDGVVTEMIAGYPEHKQPAGAGSGRTRTAGQLIREEADSVLADACHGFIAGALAETMTAGKEVKGKIGRDPDYWLDAQNLGGLIFLVFLYITPTSRICCRQLPDGMD